MNVDLLVIGGGINGLGIAAEAARRGVRVLVVDKGDIGGGTTAASSRLIHGGLRYLQYGELSLVRESLRDRGRLVRERPHLVRPIRLLIPSYSGQKLPRWMLRAGLTLYDTLARDRLFRPSEVMTASAVREREPGIDPRGLRGGFLYSDGQIEFPERLCVELRAEILRAGGSVRTYTPAIEFVVRERRVAAVRVRDLLTGVEDEVECGQVVNAGGPWVDAINALLPNAPPRLIGGTWGTHLILPLRESGPRRPLYTPARRDGRPLFMLPWDDRLLLGTTDIPFEGNPDTLKSEPGEMDYLLGEINALFPGAKYAPEDLQHRTVGIRPLPFVGGKRRAGAITRRHFLVEHRREGGPDNLYSVVGGKLSTFHSLASEVVRKVFPGRRESPDAIAESQTAITDIDLSLQARARRLGVGEASVSRLVRRYGVAAAKLFERIERDPEQGLPLVQGSAAVLAEARHAIDAEGARTVDDVLLRRLVLLPPPEGARGVVEALLCRR